MWNRVPLVFFCIWENCECVYVRVCMCVGGNMYVCVVVWVYECVWVYVCVYVCVSLQACMSVCECVCIWAVSEYMCVCVYVYVSLPAYMSVCDWVFVCVGCLHSIRKKKARLLKRCFLEFAHKILFSSSKYQVWHLKNALNYFCGNYCTMLMYLFYKHR